MLSSEETAAAARDTAAAESAPRPFNQSLPMMLMKAREGVMRRFRPHLRSHGLTDQQWRILRALAEDDRIELLELSHRCLIQPPSLSRTVPALTERGLVQREDHPSDRRRALISLTDEGRELFQVMSAESARIYAQLTEDIGGPEKLAEIYELLKDLIDEVESSADGADEGSEG
jgi:homoprotocatechuate degradation regulator HpaR